MKNKPDFSQEVLLVPLPQPFHYQGPSDTKPHVVLYARVRRLYAPQLTKIGKSVQQIQRAGGNALMFVLAAKDILDQSIEAFLNASKEEVTTGSLGVLIGRLPLVSAYKLVLWSIMMIRETSYMPTSYRCTNPRCGKTTLFDLDPDIEVPKNVERDRTFMEDFMDFYVEKPDRKHSRSFSYVMKSPYFIDGLEGDGAPAEGAEEKDTRVKVHRFEIEWPSLQDYIVAISDPKRQDDVELWVLFDNIRSINDLSDEMTTSLKAHNGFEKIMRMKAQDLGGLVAALNEFGFDIEHTWECVHCGTRHTSPFDFTNFYASLTSTR